jgi:hypothetical protein
MDSGVSMESKNVTNDIRIGQILEYNDNAIIVDVDALDKRPGIPNEILDMCEDVTDASGIVDRYDGVWKFQSFTHISPAQMKWQD